LNQIDLRLLPEGTFTQTDLKLCSDEFIYILGLFFSHTAYNVTVAPLVKLLFVYCPSAIYVALVAELLVDHPKNTYLSLVGLAPDILEVVFIKCVWLEGAPEPPLALYARVIFAALVQIAYSVMLAFPVYCPPAAYLTPVSVADVPQPANSYPSLVGLAEESVNVSPCHFVWLEGAPEPPLAL
jgi:hypothetical protein